METVSVKKKKSGRPIKATRREVRACIRYTKSEHFIIREKASKAGIRPSEYIRQVTINGQVRTRLTTEERQLARQLVGMANNLNQLAKACHQEGLLPAMLYFEGYRNQVDTILQKLKP
jgi:hypothetical protein